jgi:hypothetical protein
MLGIMHNALNLAEDGSVQKGHGQAEPQQQGEPARLRKIKLIIHFFLSKIV